METYYNAIIRGSYRIMANTPPLYVFIDESGDFNFSISGSNYYIFTAVLTHSPQEYAEEITNLRHDILSGNNLPNLKQDYLDNHLCNRFHASEDRQSVRDSLFNLIQNMNGFKVNSIVIQKNKTNPVLRQPYIFYPRFLGSLLEYIFKVYDYSSLCILVDSIPVSSRKKQFLSTIKSEIKKRNPKTTFRIYFPSSTSNNFLQITDYINWAIFRKWDKNDVRSYDLIKKFLQKPERDIFAGGKTIYY